MWDLHDKTNLCVRNLLNKHVFRVCGSLSRISTHYVSYLSVSFRHLSVRFALSGQSGLYVVQGLPNQIAHCPRQKRPDGRRRKKSKKRSFSFSEKAAKKKNVTFISYGTAVSNKICCKQPPQSLFFSLPFSLYVPCLFWKRAVTVIHSFLPVIVFARVQSLFTFVVLVPPFRIYSSPQHPFFCYYLQYVFLWLLPVFTVTPSIFSKLVK